MGWTDAQPAVQTNGINGYIAAGTSTPTASRLRELDSVQQGTRLGRYEILSTLGRGGMGEVWRARDTKLERDIAIKMLPEPFARDAQRLARLQREARLLASVSHPNIAVLYDLEQADDATFLALELVEGETLAERLIRSGPIPATEALTLALQIAEALEAAHERGVIHRDLKPANIKITPDGRVKVLDFGLAKAFDVAGLDDGRSSSPALTVARTEHGAILGTPAYMAPEQARGEAADARADVWAFGCVLFEMLAGQGAFGGETTSDVLAAVLKVAPDWSRLPKSLHPRIKLVLERCLDKNRRDRFAGISDARVEIARTLDDPRGVLVEPAAATPEAGGRQRVRFAAAVLGAVLLAALTTGLAVWQLKPSPPTQVMHFVDELPLGPPADVLSLPSLDVSRDGTQIAYFAGEAGGQPQLYVRAIDDPVARRVQGAAGGVFVTEPRFSPDGRWLAYFAAPQLVRVPVDGGTPEPIVRDLSGAVRGLHWDDERLVYAVSDGIYEVAAAGGEPLLLIKAGDGEYFASPQRLPSRDAVLFSVAAGTSPSHWDAGDVVVQSIASGQRIPVARRARDARYVRSGHIVYAQGTALYAVAFDLDRLEVTGPALRMVEDGIVRAETGQGDSAQYVVSDTGSLVYLESPPGAASNSAQKRSLVWVDRTGTAEPIDLPADDFRSARISPDGRRVALVVGGTGESRRPDLWILDLATANQRRQLTVGMSAEGPVWSTDSTRVYFRSSPAAFSTFYSIDADGGEPQLISEGSAEFSIAFPSALTPDGEKLLLVNFRDGATSIATLGLGAERGFRRVLQGASLPALSPRDGAWMAYVESIGGATNIRIVTYPDVARQAYTIAAGSGPAFSRDGRELYFVDGEALRAQSLEYEPDFRIVGAPRDVFRGRYRFQVQGRAWDVHPDGRFLVLLDAADNTAAPSSAARQRIHVVVNWVEQVRRRLAAE
jgi:serine/threonine-protein kinase